MPPASAVANLARDESVAVNRRFFKEAMLKIEQVLRRDFSVRQRSKSCDLLDLRPRTENSILRIRLQPSLLYEAQAGHGEQQLQKLWH